MEIKSPSGAERAGFGHKVKFFSLFFSQLRATPVQNCTGIARKKCTSVSQVQEAVPPGGDSKGAQPLDKGRIFIYNQL
ncbi:MAG: hypothetical protein LBF34_00710 [Puniceicoccales bacterium]|jgi:hypothetical protein|nr:hypothetical protein [Puniceicoccales bacterium]